MSTRIYLTAPARPWFTVEERQALDELIPTSTHLLVSRSNGLLAADLYYPGGAADRVWATTAGALLFALTGVLARVFPTLSS